MMLSRLRSTGDDWGVLDFDLNREIAVRITLVPCAFSSYGTANQLTNDARFQ